MTFRSWVVDTVYTKDFVGVTPASVFRYVDFPELICKPIKHNGEIFYNKSSFIREKL